MPYTAIHSEGGLIPGDILDQIAQESLPGQKATDFGLEKGRRLSEEISRAWSDAQDYWHIFARRSADLPEGETGTTLTRERWVTRLFNDLLGYGLAFQAAGAAVDGRTYPISHRAGASEESPPVHIEGFRVDLDRRPPAGHRRLSPQALVQDYLNRSEQQLWGVVTNGHRLRLLRETPRTSRPAYLEFDLQSILEGSRFNEFALFYRLCHRTRLPRAGEDASKCLLEGYYQESIDQGGRVRDRLRDGVEEALKILGTGFLRHPENTALRERIQAGKLTAPEYHRQLLRLVYRLLFLMVAEERRMIVPEGPETDRRQRLYDCYYSLARLRDRAEAVLERSPFSDLWLGLCRTFQLFNDVPGENPLGIPPLNGDLFSYRAMPDLEGTRLPNHELLLAMRHLCLFRERGVQQRVNYSALDVEELGSVYESLLDFQPAAEQQPEGVAFELHTGTERKSTGSYYTRPELVAELVESALVPVLEERVNAAKTREEKERAILSMKVCDSASGSGHFLLAAARRMGRELAKARTGEEEPTPEKFHLAVRDVISHCIYGVDVNPLAVDLCKLSLWLEGHWSGKPLSFLDHHIKCGNSLIGMFEAEALKRGIPDEAFKPVTGDDKKAASAIKKRNKKERESPTRRLRFERTPLGRLEDLALQLGQLSEVAEDSPGDVKRKAELYRRIHESPDTHRAHRAANLWTAAFFAPLTRPDDPAVPTTESLKEFIESGTGYGPMIGQADSLALKHRFFHWFLEFPEVFAGGGFDVVLGNPPWERIKLQEREFFALRAPQIANAQTAATRLSLIEALEESPKLTERDLYQSYREALHKQESETKFSYSSQRFPQTAKGDVNTYPLFAELGTQLVNSSGRLGQVLKTGIASADTTKDFFGALVSERRLVTLIDFANKRGIFPDVIANERFCLLSAAASGKGPQAFLVSVLNETVEQARDLKRAYTLTAEDVRRINPNTLTCPLFYGPEDAEVCRRLYDSNPVLIDESGNRALNSWNIEYYTMFHMTNDSDLFRDKEWLQERGFTLDGNVFRQADESYLPLYEGKLLNLFDHRHGTFEGVPRSSRFGIKAEPHHPDELHKADPSYEVEPRYWVSCEHVLEEFERRHIPRDALFIFRDVCRAFTDSRTARGTLVPWCAAGNSAPVLIFQDAGGIQRKERMLLFACIFGSFVFDFIVRQKLSSAHLNRFTLAQIATPRPESFQRKLLFDGVEGAASEQVVGTAFGLFCNTESMLPFFKDFGVSAPVPWDPAARDRARCLIDAIIAKCYGLTRSEYAYVLTRFPILQRQENEKYGEFRSERLCLEAWDRLH
jgi:hypothetical protein